MDATQMYRCERCHYETNFLSVLKNHLNRKKPCATLFSTASCADLLQVYAKKNKYVATHKCSFCEKMFGTRQGKYNHQQLCMLKFDKQNEACKKKIKESAIKDTDDYMKNKDVYDSRCSQT